MNEKIPYTIKKRLEIVKSLEHTKISSPDGLIDIVCELAGTSKNEILPQNEAGKRTQEIFGIRQAIQYLLKKKFELPYIHIGRLTHRNHGSVIHAIKGLEEILEMYGKHVQPQDPEDIQRRLSRYAQEHETAASYTLYTTLEIKLPLQEANVYYVVRNRRHVPQKEVSKTTTL